MSNLFTRLQACFPAAPDALFAILDGGARVSYGDLDRSSGQFANALTALGVAHGDRVAVQTAKSIEMVFLYLACLRIGAIFLPLNTAYTTGELDYFMRDASPSVFVCDPTRVDAIRALAAAIGVPRVETLGAQGDGSLAEAARSRGRRRRASRDPVHVRYHRPLQGRDAEP
jgi:malonyl-CoA/methylmalonyl-CoA synthetase